jgi:hypothetical protein
VAALLIAAATGHSAEPLDFGVFDHEPQLAAWLDLAPMVSTSRVEKIRDGVDLVIDFRLTLKRPRRLWGAETITMKQGIVTIGYRIVTEDFVLQTGGRDFQRVGRFATLAGLHRFLTDSIVVDLINYTELDSLSRYRLQLELTSISMTGLNLAPASDSLEGEESALKYLFRHFLKLTGFGQESLSARTEPFSPAEVRRR